jgi:hypothetical protein
METPLGATTNQLNPNKGPTKPHRSSKRSSTNTGKKLFADLAGCAVDDDPPLFVQEGISRKKPKFS